MTLRRHVVPIVAALISGCAVGRMASGLVAHDNPARLVGTWVDSSTASPTDTVAWVLGPRGLDQTLTRHLAADAGDRGRWTENLDGYGYWYVPSNAPAADTGRICFRSRGRGRDACFQYELSTTPAARRRLLIVAYQGRHHTRDRVLVER